MWNSDIRTSAFKKAPQQSSNTSYTDISEGTASPPLPAKKHHHHSHHHHHHSSRSPHRSHSASRSSSVTQTEPLVVKASVGLATVFLRRNPQLKFSTPPTLLSSSSTITQLSTTIAPEPMQEDNGLDLNMEIPPDMMGKSLTKPDVPAHGLQHDNENFDLILRVGEMLGSSEESGECVLAI